ncbi:MAG: hypothetical protein A3B68_06390 [Candidatus Melainabacteria bacterium RIFCSPHIGHO2_02_FULL_34_12]|nr:MAG: hypothetical protein A3B68_06390 [Candidatus Melainabacteria bacterium RIFCSPHIGHO2_02_FULL_34_12]
MVTRLVSLFLVFIVSVNQIFAQNILNETTSVSWENNSLILNTTNKITYAEARLKDPERLIIDILNCSLQNKSLETKFRSELDENISVSEPTQGQVRIIFQGISSINRKAYLTNNERTLIIKVARIDTEENGKITESSDQTDLEKYTPGKFKDIIVEGIQDETEITISSTKSIKYNTYALKNPDRIAIDLLNVLPPESSLPKFNPTFLVSGIRIGRAASSIDATRIVIDLAKENIDSNIDSTLLGNKLKIKLKINKEKEEERKKSSIKVVIDPGHGGYDTGASYGGFDEKDVNLVISEKLKKSLEEYGIAVFLTRDDDGFLSLAERVEITNSIKPHVFISIHGNALKTTRTIRGVETYWWTGKSEKLAYLIHKSILSHIKIPDHFIRKARFFVIRHASCPAILAELGFLSNHDDRKLLTNSTTQDKYAKALTEAILKFLDVEPRKEERNGESAMGRDGEKKKQ